MDIIGTLVTVLSAMGGWEAVKWFLNRKSNSRVAEAEAETESNAHRVAKGVLDGLFCDAGAWLSDERFNAAV